MKKKLTSYRSDFLCIFPSDQKDNVPLRGIDIVVLQKEKLVDAILLKRAELDKEAHGRGEGLFDDYVLLAADLISDSV